MDTTRWTSALDEISSEFTDQFTALTAEQLNWKPDRDTWSIAQNIDHLIVVNKTYFPVVASVRNKTGRVPWYARAGFMVRFFGRIILDSVQPTNGKKIKTFAMWAPSQTSIPADILERFVQHQSELKKLISGSSDLLDRQPVISSPANYYIVYDLATAFDIIVAHERRHLKQAKEVRGERN